MIVMNCAAHDEWSMIMNAGMIIMNWALQGWQYAYGGC
jgi:hypothetical protein